MQTFLINSLIIFILILSLNILGILWRRKSRKRKQPVFVVDYFIPTIVALILWGLLIISLFCLHILVTLSQNLFN